MEHFLSESALSGMKPHEFDSIDKATKHRIRKYISQCCEKSFRRGFQQGYDTAIRGDAVVDLEKWRFMTPSDESPSPHGTYSSTAEERFDMECSPLEVGLYKRR
jgi:hypothetical protein